MHLVSLGIAQLQGVKYSKRITELTPPSDLRLPEDSSIRYKLDTKESALLCICSTTLSATLSTTISTTISSI